MNDFFLKGRTESDLKRILKDKKDDLQAFVCDILTEDDEVLKDCIYLHSESHFFQIPKGTAVIVIKAYSNRFYFIETRLAMPFLLDSLKEGESAFGDLHAKNYVKFEKDKIVIGADGTKIIEIKNSENTSIESPIKISLKAKDIELTGNVKITGDLTVTGKTTLASDSTLKGKPIAKVGDKIKIPSTSPAGSPSDGIIEGE
jgi:hypothetical protein